MPLMLNKCKTDRNIISASDVDFSEKRILPVEDNEFNRKIYP